MAKLADAPDLGSGAARRVGSTPIIRTKARGSVIHTPSGLSSTLPCSFGAPSVQTHTDCPSPKSLSDAGGVLCGLNMKLSSEKSLRRRRWTLRLECETFF
jgi:hypothetical protein